MRANGLRAHAAARLDPGSTSVLFEIFCYELNFNEKEPQKASMPEHCSKSVAGNGKQPRRSSMWTDMDE
jgi:hypothetical protein